ncbi:MAG: DUF3782 domain-containing protein [Candidatus Bathyarchaeia archaeon]
MESLKREFLELLDKDVEFRYAVAGYLGLSEILKRLDAIAGEQTRLAEEQINLRKEQARLAEEQTKIWNEIRALREEQTKIWVEIERFREEQTKTWENITKIWEEIKALREEQVRLREEQTKIWGEISRFREEQAKTWVEIERLREEQIRLREDMRVGFESMRRHIDALGARWGIVSESTFRDGLRGILEREFGFKIEKWIKHDEDGFVFGYPSIIDIDVAIHDERVILIEIKSHVDKRDVYDLKRKSEFYRSAEGREPYRLIIVTPYADEEALEAARKLKIEIYTKV